MANPTGMTSRSRLVRTVRPPCRPPATARPLSCPGPYALVGAVLLSLLCACAERRAEGFATALSHPDPEIRQQASYELVTLGRAAIPAVLARAEQGSDSLLYISAQVLGRIAEPAAVPFLLRLTGSPNTFVRAEATLALGKCGRMSVLPQILVLLADDGQPEVRAAAAASVAALRDTSVGAALQQALSDSSALVRRRVLASLHQLWFPGLADPVMAALRDPDATVRYIAAQILGLNQVSEATDGLCAALQDTSVWVRTEAACALGKIGDPAVARYLVRVMQDYDGPDSDAAHQALRLLTGAEYVIVP